MSRIGAWPPIPGARGAPGAAPAAPPDEPRRGPAPIQDIRADLREQCAQRAPKSAIRRRTPKDPPANRWMGPGCTECSRKPT
eukprot:9504170-Pyramimonas_sp.AAC.3